MADGQGPKAPATATAGGRVLVVATAGGKRVDSTVYGDELRPDPEHPGGYYVVSPPPE